MAEDKTETKISFIDACLEVWTEPRETVREIIDHKPGYGIWVFILLGGLLETLNPTYTYGFLKWMPLSLAFGAALFFIEMDNIISFWVGSTIAYGLGKILGGKGTFWGVATANAWASPPILVATFFFAYMKLPLWLKILKGANPLPEGPMIWWQVLLGVVACVFALWALVVAVANLMEAQQISLWKSFFINAFCIGLEVLELEGLKKIVPFLYLLDK